MTNDRSRFVFSLRDSGNPSKCLDLFGLDSEDLEFLFESVIDDINNTRSSDYDDVFDFLDTLSIRLSTVSVLREFLKEVDNDVSNTVPTSENNC